MDADDVREEKSGHFIFKAFIFHVFLPVFSVADHISPGLISRLIFRPFTNSLMDASSTLLAHSVLYSAPKALVKALVGKVTQLGISNL